MPGFGEGSVFGQIQPTDLAAMLQAAFAAQPAAPGLDYMAIPNMHQQTQEPITMSGVQIQPNALTNLGGGLGQAAQLVGSVMAANKKPPQSWNVPGGVAPLPGSPNFPIITGNEDLGPAGNP